MVESQFSKLIVAGSSPVLRSDLLNRSSIALHQGQGDNKVSAWGIVPSGKGG